MRSLRTVEFEEFDRHVVVEDHGDPDAGHRRGRFTDQLLALECTVEIINLEGNMGFATNQL